MTDNNEVRGKVVKKYVSTSSHGGMVAVVSNDYSGTYVSHDDYAALQAEAEALRAEVAAWSKSYDRAVDLGQQHRDRAERLAEALREFPAEPNPYTYRIAHAKARAALHPTAAQENDDA